MEFTKNRLQECRLLQISKVSFEDQVLLHILNIFLPTMFGRSETEEDLVKGSTLRKQSFQFQDWDEWNPEADFKITLNNNLIIHMMILWCIGAGCPQNRSHSSLLSLENFCEHTCTHILRFMFSLVKSVGKGKQALDA